MLLFVKKNERWQPDRLTARGNVYRTNPSPQQRPFTSHDHHQPQPIQLELGQAFVGFLEFFPAGFQFLLAELVAVFFAKRD